MIKWFTFSILITNILLNIPLNAPHIIVYNILIFVCLKLSTTLLLTSTLTKLLRKHFSWLWRPKHLYLNFLSKMHCLLYYGERIWAKKFIKYNFQITVCVCVCVCVLNLYLVTKYVPGFQGPLVHCSSLDILDTRNTIVYVKRKVASFFAKVGW